MRKSGVTNVPVYAVWTNADVRSVPMLRRKQVRASLYLDNIGLLSQGKAGQAEPYIGQADIFTEDVDAMCRMGMWGPMSDGRHMAVAFTGDLAAQAVRNSEGHPEGMHLLAVRPSGPCCYGNGACGKVLSEDFLYGQEKTAHEIRLREVEPALKDKTRRLVRSIKADAYIPANDFGTYAKLSREGRLLNPKSGDSYLSRPDTERVARQTLSYVAEQADFFAKGSQVASLATGREPVTAADILEKCCHTAECGDVTVPLRYGRSPDAEAFEARCVQTFANELERTTGSNMVSGMESLVTSLSSMGMNIRTDDLLRPQTTDASVIRETLRDLHSDGVISGQTWSDWRRDMSREGLSDRERLGKIQDVLSLVYLQDALGLSDACMSLDASVTPRHGVGTHEMIYGKHGLGETVQSLFSSPAYQDARLNGFAGHTVDETCKRMEASPGTWLSACNTLADIMDRRERYYSNGFDLVCARDLSGDYARKAKADENARRYGRHAVSSRPDRPLPEYESRRALLSNEMTDDTQYE